MPRTEGGKPMRPTRTEAHSRRDRGWLGACGLVCLLASFVDPGTAVAQSSMGGVTGTVTDATGAVVAGASVTLVAVETKVKNERKTNDRGHFVFVNVRPGRYELAIELAGFATTKVSAFTVGVNETVARNVSLRVGDVSEAMEVSAQSELLQASTSELGNVVEERVIRGVPSSPIANANR